MKVPIVAIVGRPNVGKSFLFNRIVKKQHAVVSEVAGTTRDRVMVEVELPNTNFLLVDTGGIQMNLDMEDLEQDVKLQARVAIEDADIVLFVVDSKMPLTSEEEHIAEILRKNKKPNCTVNLVLSKCDQQSEDILLERSDIYQLGFDTPFLTSSAHNWGVKEIIDFIEKDLESKHFKKEDRDPEADRRPHIALMGKPNAGKSSMINALLSEPKLIVSDIPGTTRDSTDTLVRYEKNEYNFIDTAGIRRKGKIERGIEKFSIMRTMQSLYRSDIVLMVIDGDSDITAQDQHIAGDIKKNMKGLIIVVNKWDLREKGEEEQTKYIHQLRRKFAFVPWAPVVFISAKTRKNLPKIFPIIDKIMEERKKRISTGELNTFQREMASKHLPSRVKKTKTPKIYYVTQTDVNPPEFVFFVNDESAFHFSYPRYLENQIRKKFGFVGTAIRIVFREKDKKRRKK